MIVEIKNKIAKIGQKIDSKTAAAFTALVTMLYSSPAFASGGGELETVTTALTEVANNVKGEITNIIPIAAGIFGLVWGVKKIFQIFKGFV